VPTLVHSYTFLYIHRVCYDNNIDTNTITNTNNKLPYRPYHEHKHNSNPYPYWGGVRNGSRPRSRANDSHRRTDVETFSNRRLWGLPSQISLDLACIHVGEWEV